MSDDTPQSYPSTGNFRLSGGEAFAESEIPNLPQLLSFINAGRRTITATTCAAMLIGILYLLIVPPAYQADGLIQIEENPTKGNFSTQLNDLSSVLLGTPVETRGELQILRSRLVLGGVIETLGLLIQAKPRYFPVVGAPIFRLHQKAKEPIRAPSILRSYAWGGERIAVGTFDVPEPFLNKHFRLLSVQGGFEIRYPDGATLLKGSVGKLSEVETKDGHFAILVKELLAIPGTTFDLVRRREQDVLTELSSHLYVAEQGKQSAVIMVSFIGKSPSLVANVVNSLEDVYLDQNIERRSANAKQSLDFLQRQLPQLRNEVDAAQAQMNAYQSASGSVDVAEETLQALKKSSELETERLKLVQHKEELLGKFTPEHPAVKAIAQQIISLDSAKAKLEQQVGRLPGTQREIFSLKRNVEVSNALYAQMLNSVEALQVAKAGTVGNVRIVDHALVPTKSVSPKAAHVFAYALPLGLLAGLAIVFIRRALLRGVDNPSEVESRLGIMTYGVIPFSQKQRRLAQGLRRGGQTEYILANEDPEDIAIEAIRSLRTGLQFALLEATNNVVMITGPSPNLGKSFVSINLAAVLATLDKKVIVIDADLRRGHLHEYISATATPGVSDYVIGQAEMPSIVRHSSLDGLHTISRGSIAPNPAELLMHQRFITLIRTLSSSYDYVLIDTPPILAVTDAAIVGKLAGCTLLLLKSAEHRYREIEDAIKRLHVAGITVKGIIFNQLGAKPGSVGYGNYAYTNYRYTAG